MDFFCTCNSFGHGHIPKLFFLDFLFFLIDYIMKFLALVFDRILCVSAFLNLVQPIPTPPFTLFPKSTHSKKIAAHAFPPIPLSSIPCSQISVRPKTQPPSALSKLQNLFLSSSSYPQIPVTVLDIHSSKFYT
ncbi:hypothetical protein BDZ91DRAFT_308507 [Kalaharituber pfeilii]|nr:hypothetical protein BDZ91DRAFT_308507 [Kalaharituber pfeilii]